MAAIKELVADAEAPELAGSMKTEERHQPSRFLLLLTIWLRIVMAANHLVYCYLPAFLISVAHFSTNE